MLDSSACLLQYVTLSHSVGCYMKYIIINLMAFRTTTKNSSYFCSAVQFVFVQH